MLRTKRRISGPEMDVDARRSVRRVPVASVTAWVESPGLLVQVTELSDGGFAIFAVQPFEPGTVGRFLFTVETGLSFQLLAKAVHCAPLVPGEEQYLSGWEFSNNGQDRLIREFLDAAV